MRPEASWFAANPWSEVRERAIIENSIPIEALDCPLAKHLANKVNRVLLRFNQQFCYAVLVHYKDKLLQTKIKIEANKGLKAKENNSR